MNYLAWTANLGVVPLFLLAAFLLAPAAFLLALRRFSVTAVLDAIYNSLKISTYQLMIKKVNLTTYLLFVKIFLFLPCVFLSYSYAEDVVMAKGEQKELIISASSQFSVGNPELISYKYLPKQKKILLKGKKIGFTDILFWTPEGKKRINIYVLSKKKFLKTIELAEMLKETGLNLQIRGGFIHVEGQITEERDYFYLKKIKKQYLEQIYFNVRLSPKLKTHLFSLIYLKLERYGFERFYCESNLIDIFCYLKGYNETEALKTLADNFQIRLLKEESAQRTKNYRLKLSIFQIETSQNDQRKWGFDELKLPVKELFQTGLSKGLDQNTLQSSFKDAELSSLAEPELIVNLDQKQQIELGSQIAFQNTYSTQFGQGSQLDWRFAGLKLETELKEVDGKLFLKYQLEFSKPETLSISGTKESSSLYLTPNETSPMFHLRYEVDSSEHQSLPFIHKIPILRRLFSSNTKTLSKKNIIGHVTLEEIHHD